MCTAPPLKLIDLPGLDQRIVDDKMVSFEYILFGSLQTFFLNCFKKHGNTTAILDCKASFQKKKKVVGPS